MSQVLDNFTYSDTSSISSNSTRWVGVAAGNWGVSSNSGYINNLSTAEGLMYYEGVNFLQDQFAQITYRFYLTGALISWVGVSVRGSNVGGYEFYASPDNDTYYIGWIDNSGNWNSIGNTSIHFEPGRSLKLAIAGTSLSAYANTTSWTKSDGEMGLVAVNTDATYSSGAPGLGGFSSSSPHDVIFATDWYGGDLVEPTKTFGRPIINWTFEESSISSCCTNAGISNANFHNWQPLQGWQLFSPGGSLETSTFTAHSGTKSLHVPPIGGNVAIIYTDGQYLQSGGWHLGSSAISMVQSCYCNFWIYPISLPPAGYYTGIVEFAQNFGTPRLDLHSDGTLSVFDNGNQYTLISGTTGSVPLNTWTNIQFASKNGPPTTPSVWEVKLGNETVSASSTAGPSTAYSWSAQAVKIYGISRLGSDGGNMSTTSGPPEFYLDDVFISDESYTPPSVLFRQISSLTGNIASGTSVTIPLPETTQDKDVMLAFLHVEDSASGSLPGLSIPSGWTQLGDVFANSATAGNRYHILSFWKRAASEVGPYTWSWTNASFADGAILSYSGCVSAIVNSVPYDQYQSSSAVSYGTSWAVPNLNLHYPNECVVSVYTGVKSSYPHGETPLTTPGTQTGFFVNGSDDNSIDFDFRSYVIRFWSQANSSTNGKIAVAEHYYDINSTSGLSNTIGNSGGPNASNLFWTQGYTEPVGIALAVSLIPDGPFPSPKRTLINWTFEESSLTAMTNLDAGEHGFAISGTALTDSLQFHSGSKSLHIKDLSPVGGAVNSNGWAFGQDDGETEVEAIYVNFWMYPVSPRTTGNLGIISLQTSDVSVLPELKMNSDGTLRILDGYGNGYYTPSTTGSVTLSAWTNIKCAFKNGGTGGNSFWQIVLGNESVSSSNFYPDGSGDSSSGSHFNAFRLGSDGNGGPVEYWIDDVHISDQGYDPPPIIFRQRSSYNLFSGKSLTAVTPDGTQVDDVMLAFLHIQDSASSSTGTPGLVAPSGWNALADFYVSSTADSVAYHDVVYWKRATTADMWSGSNSAGASATWSWQNSVSEADWGILSYSGAVAATLRALPYDQFQSGTAVLGNISKWSLPSLSPQYQNEMLITPSSLWNTTTGLIWPGWNPIVSNINFLRRTSYIRRFSSLFSVAGNLIAAELPYSSLGSIGNVFWQGDSGELAAVAFAISLIPAGSIVPATPSVLNVFTVFMQAGD